MYYYISRKKTTKSRGNLKSVRQLIGNKSNQHFTKQYGPASVVNTNKFKVVRGLSQNSVDRSHNLKFH